MEPKCQKHDCPIWASCKPGETQDECPDALLPCPECGEIATLNEEGVCIACQAGRADFLEEVYSRTGKCRVCGEETVLGPSDECWACGHEVGE